MVNPSIDIDERNHLDTLPEGTAEQADAERLAAWFGPDDAPLKGSYSGYSGDGEGVSELEHEWDRLASLDDEPADIDSDDGYDPYTGGPESPYEGDDAGDWYGND